MRDNRLIIVFILLGIIILVLLSLAVSWLMESILKIRLSFWQSLVLIIVLKLILSDEPLLKISRRGD